MTTKANLGQERSSAISAATAMNAQFQLKKAHRDTIDRINAHNEGVPFDEAITEFIDKYIHDYRLKASTARKLIQRRERLISALRDTRLPLIDTRVLRAVIADASQFEQSKLKTLLNRFFQYSMSSGSFPAYMTNPVANLYVDPTPAKRRQRITLEQFNAIYEASPEWLKWLLTLGLHLALRRIDLVNLQFDDIRGDRVVSAIRKTDTDARQVESTSVDFPMHPDVRTVLARSRLSSMANGRCQFVIHRTPERKTKRLVEAVRSGRMQHTAQVLPQYASKAFDRARSMAVTKTNLFAGLRPKELPTLHEVRSLSSFLYAEAGYDVNSVQNLMAHTDPDMTRAYQRGHARKVLRVDMQLPFSVLDREPGVREPATHYRAQSVRSIRECSLRIL